MSDDRNNRRRKGSGFRLESAQLMTDAHKLYRTSGFRDIAAYEGSEIPPEFQKHWVFKGDGIVKRACDTGSLIIERITRHSPEFSPGRLGVSPKLSGNTFSERMRA